jgi:hypothetical protein
MKNTRIVKRLSFFPEHDEDYWYYVQKKILWFLWIDHYCSSSLEEAKDWCCKQDKQKRLKKKKNNIVEVFDCE